MENVYKGIGLFFLVIGILLIVFGLHLYSKTQAFDPYLIILGGFTAGTFAIVSICFNKKILMLTFACASMILFTYGIVSIS